MELVGIYNSNNLDYKIEIDKTLRLNKEKDIKYKLSKINGNILIISNFITKNCNKYIKLHITLSKEKHIINSFIVHGDIKNNSYIETHKEYLVQNDLYESFKSNFNFINNISFINSFAYKLIENKIDLLNYNNDFSNDKILEKITVNEYIILHKNLIYVDNLNSYQISLIKAVFKKCVVTDFYKNNNEDNNENNNDNFIIKLSNESNYENKDNKLIIYLSDNIYENIKFLFENHKEINTILSQLKEYIPKEVKSDNNNSKCSSKNCCGGTCGKEPSEKKEEIIEESTDKCCSKKKSCKDTEGCCSNKPDSECCKKNPEISCNCEKETEKESETSDKKELPDFIKNNKGLLLFMKGTKEEPKCKFSRITVEKLNENNIEYNTFNILDDSILREDLKVHCKTYPQMWKDSEFFCNGDTIKESENVKELFQII